VADIFISYAREDRERAKELAGMLEQRGWSVWWDRLIPAGGSFNRIIEEELTRAKCVIVLWSRHSVESNYVQNEAGEAERRGVLVPVLVEDVRIPLPFRHLQATPIEETDHIVTSIGALVGRSEMPQAVHPQPRRATWIAAVVIAALIVTIVLIAQKSQEPPPTTTTQTTAVVDTAKASRADDTLEIRLWRNQVDRSLNAYTKVDRNVMFPVAGRNLLLKIHCGVGIDRKRVTVALGDKGQLATAETSDGILATIPADWIGPLGKRLQVLYETVEVTSLHLRDAR
jgi:hypothetical protein